MNLHAERYVGYLREERNMRERSLKDYIMAVDLLRSEIVPEKATDFREVNDAIKNLKAKRSWSTSTTAKIATCLKNYYAWLAREKIIESNPFPFHEFKRGRPKTPEYLTESEFENLIADPLITTQELAVIRILWDCAVRVSELCALDQADLNFEEGYVHVPREKSKGGYSDRVIPFTDETKSVLRLHVKTLTRNGITGPLFVNKWWNRAFPQDISEWLKKIGIRRSRCREAIRLTPHMFRHSFGMRMVPLVGEIITSKFLGHSSLSMTQHYTHLDRESALKIYKNIALKSA